MYNDAFDKELIEYLQIFFIEQKVELSNITSFIIRDNTYEIKFANENVVLKLQYEKEDANCEAQIRITNILLKGKMKGIGLSKKLLNKLLVYCKNHGDMSLWIYDLINQSWFDYLVQHGAVVFKEESLLEGAVVLLRETIS